MSSYGSMTPPGETSPALDRYEPQFFCGPTHVQGSPMETHMYWQGSNLEPEYEHRELYHDTGHYIGRSYGYEDVQMTPPADAYGDAYSQHQSIIQHNMHNNNNVECEYSHQPPPHAPHSYVRVVKRRNTANKKERRRTQSINTAFSDLRDCIPNVPHDTKLSKKERRRTQSVNTAFSDLRERIPNVPQDTKLSKIKTLRLATSYISYLMRVLECDSEPAGGWSAELQHPAPRRQRHQHALQPTIRQDCDGGGGEECKRTKGRTGWPQHVWALELKQEQNIQA